MAYQILKEIFGGDRFTKLTTVHGTRVQRLPWASISTKNPEYSDVKYVEATIGPDTVNTAPMETIDAYHNHGEPKATASNMMSGKPTGYCSNCRNWISASTTLPVNWKTKESRNFASLSTS